MPKAMEVEGTDTLVEAAATEVSSNKAAVVDNGRLSKAYP